MLSKEEKNKIQVIPVSNIKEALIETLDWKGKEAILNKIK